MFNFNNLESDIREIKFTNKTEAIKVLKGIRSKEISKVEFLRHIQLMIIQIKIFFTIVSIWLNSEEIIPLFISGSMIELFRYFFVDLFTITLLLFLYFDTREKVSKLNQMFDQLMSEVENANFR